MTSLSSSHSIPMDRITYDIINNEAERRREHMRRNGIYTFPDNLEISCSYIGMSYDEDLQMAHFRTDEEPFTIDQTQTHYLLTVEFGRTYEMFLIDKRTGKSEYKRPWVNIPHKPELYISLIRVYGQTQRALILELIKSHLIRIYCRHEREEKSKQPLIKIIDDALNPYYDASGWLNPEQGRIFKEFINA